MGGPRDGVGKMRVSGGWRRAGVARQRPAASGQRPRQPRHARAIARPREAVVVSAAVGDVRGRCDIAAAGDGGK